MLHIACQVKDENLDQLFKHKSAPFFSSTVQLGTEFVAPTV